MTPTETGPERDDRDDRDDEPILPDRSSDDTDRGWGDEPEEDDVERLRRERPPHW
jgi:hypothetical protein